MIGCGRQNPNGCHTQIVSFVSPGGVRFIDPFLRDLLSFNEGNSKALDLSVSVSRCVPARRYVELLRPSSWMASGRHLLFVCYGRLVPSRRQIIPLRIPFATNTTFFARYHPLICSSLAIPALISP